MFPGIPRQLRQRGELGHSGVLNLNPASGHSLHQALNYECEHEKSSENIQRYRRKFQRIEKPHHDSKQAGQYAQKNQSTLQGAALDNPKRTQVGEEVDQQRQTATMTLILPSRKSGCCVIFEYSIDT